MSKGGGSKIMTGHECWILNYGGLQVVGDESVGLWLVVGSGCKIMAGLGWSHDLVMAVIFYLY